MSSTNQRAYRVCYYSPAMIDAQRLWLAVLEQAVIDLTLADNGAVSQRPRLRYFTHLWFTSDNHEPGSFRWICDHLDLDPS
ncbi:MAG: hypothetical protein E6J74_04970 [Deltaproteobacteria bacterium]|nr:MAG: hypothetical protein E6J74_04970 [Deltaproteobacteria bacterium]